VGDDRQACVYKVGGSLFDWPRLLERLSAFLRSEPTWPLIVSGGGGAADVVRGWDRVHGLGEERAHRLAVRSLGLGAAFLADGLDGGTLVTSRNEAATAWSAGRLPVLDAAAFLAAEEAAGALPLPASWDVTSDSIAAWVAARWPADLVLLKSTSPDRPREQFVDPFFPEARSQVRRAEWVDLRTGERGGL
jgi:5-(aminomethyl)-3-furanmethanol phosphate kinase